MRTIAALIAAVLIPLALAGCELYIDDDEPEPQLDAGAVGADASAAVDAALPTCASLGCPTNALCNAGGVCTCAGELCSP